MKLTYTVQTSNYIWKNFLYIVPFALIPAFFLSLSVAGETISAVLKAFFTGNLSAWTFFDLFRAISVLNFGSLGSALSGFLGMVVIVPCVALLTAFLEKHMRIGKRTFNGILEKLNDNFFSAFLFGVLVLVVYEIWSVIAAAMLYFISLIPNLPTAYVFIVLVFLALHAVLLYALGALYLWLPCMQITGFPVMESLQHSYQLVQPVRWGIFAEQVTFLLLTETVIGVCAVFLPQSLIFTIITTALIVFLLLYYFVRMEIVYFDRDHIQRMDLKKYGSMTSFSVDEEEVSPQAKFYG